MPAQIVLSESRVPVKVWSSEIEDEARAQLQRTAALPFVFKHVAAMPDVHAGKGATVGSVVATRDAIVPACVGVDIGCGMMAVKTPLRADDVLGKLREVRHSIERSIPVGRHGHKQIRDEALKWFCGFKDLGLPSTGDFKRAQEQLGTLGGGNHFIEVCLDTEGGVWVMLHSGSRNIGKVIAEHHIDKAKGLMKQYFIELADPDLAYLARGTREFVSYVVDLDWAQAYAFENRKQMMDLVMKELAHAFNEGEPLERIVEVNCHHNYVAWEHHYGENVMVTRKGAVRAREGELGIIPGSMGAKSFIVRGRGNAESFHSCSHGAGRRMSRTKARASFTVADLEAQTAGVECRKDEGVLDEIPGAYKDIDEVMANQSDLVEIVAQLKQVLCVKG